MQRSIKKQPASRHEFIDFSKIADQSLSAHFVVYNDAVVYCNPAFEQMSGYSAKELYAHSLKVLPRLFTQASMELFGQLKNLCLEGGQIAYHPEIDMVRKDGSRGWVEMIVNPIAFKGKGAVYCSCIDRTERKRQRDATTGVIQLYCDLLSNIHLLAVMFDIQGMITFCNDSILECLGWYREELIGRNWFDCCVADAELRQRYFEMLSHTPETVSDEYHIITKTGEPKTLLLSSTVVRDAAGKVTTILSVGEDMTERIRILHAMRENQEKFASIVEYTHDGISLADEEGCIISWNCGLEEISGIKREEILGKPQWDVAYGMMCDEERSEELRERLKLFHEELLITGVLKRPSTMIHRLQRPDGTRKVVQIDVFTIHTSRGHRIGTIIRDVSELYAVKDALDQSEMRYRVLAEAIPEILFVIARDGTISFANSNAARFLSLPAQEITGKKYRDLLPPAFIISLENALAKIFETGSMLRQENKVRDVLFETHLAPVVDAYGRVTAVLWISYEMTPRKNAEQVLQETGSHGRSELRRPRKKHEQSKVSHVFDKARLFAITGNDHSALKKFLELTLLTGESMVENIERSIEGNDLGKVALLANGLKETAVQLGATHVAETSAAVMLAAREGRIDACRRMTPSLKRETGSLFDALRAMKL